MTNLVLRHSRSHLDTSVLYFPPNSGGVSSGGTQRCALPRYQSEEMKILNISFREGIESNINKKSA